MYSFILRKFNINQQETGFAFLLFFSAGLLGIFLSTFDIAAHAMFLDTYGQIDLAYGYLFSGAIGVVLFYFYSQLFKRLSSYVFYFVNLLTILVVSLTYFYFSIISPSKETAFLGLIIMFPLNLLALLNFWRYVRRTLKPAQSRKLFHFVEFGFILGTIGGSYGVIGILLFYDYYIIGLVTLTAIILLFLLQFPLKWYHRRSLAFNHRPDKYLPVRKSSFLLLTTKYTRFLFYFTLLSSVIGFIIHFGFVNLTRLSFPHIVGMSKFYGLFIGSLFIFLYGVDRFLIRRILYSYDSPFSLILMPVAMGIVLLGTIGVYFTIGSSSTALSRFTFMFILLVMNKMIYETTRYTLQLPATHTLFRTLDIRFLQIIYPRVEGSLVMLGMVIAGAIILFLLSFKLFTLIGILITCILLTILWFYVGVKLIRQYQTALQDTYKKMRVSRTSDHLHESYTEKIRKILVNVDPVRVISALKLSAEIEPISYENNLRRMLANPDPVIQSYVLKCIRKESMVDLLPELKILEPITDEGVALLKTTIIDFEKKSAIKPSKQELDTLINSREPRDRISASEIMANHRDLLYTSALINLSREFEPEVRRAAVKAMARISNSDHCYILIEFLSSPQYHAYAFDALVKIGEPALEYLERLFIETNTDDSILSRVVKLYGKIGTERSIELLLNKLENQSRRVTMHTIEALRDANFQATSLNLHKILNVVVKVISNIGWDYLIFTSLPNDKIYKEIKNSYNKEIEMNYDLLFELLALTYNPRTISEIRDLIENGAQAEISHAIELLDQFIFEDIKPVLFPILENLPPREVVKKLQYYFPIESMAKEDIIIATLTRDYNLLSLYPRIAAMQLVLQLPEVEISQEIVANLFHPNRLIREVAADVIFKKDPLQFQKVAQRLESSILRELTKVTQRSPESKELLLFDKFNILRQTQRLSLLEEEILIEIAETLEITNFTPEMICDLKAKGNEYNLFIVLSEKVQLNKELVPSTKNGMYELYYSKILIDFGVTNIQFPQGATVLSLNNETLESLLFDYSEMASCVLACVEQFKIAV